MARCLIVGCGGRGLALTRELRAAGHAVRGTTRDPSRCGEIEAAGAQAWVADPDRVATIVPAFAQVGVALLLLGSASGSREQLEALHGTRLDMLLERMLDTTVRAVVYESAGSVPEDVLTQGSERVRYACRRSLIPYVLLDVGPDDHRAWRAAAMAAVDQALGVAYDPLRYTPRIGPGLG
ncbi:MAG: NAD(P)H-binding protein [Solirubrobacteraceae bacterium]